MTADEFQATALAYLRSSVNWRARIAASLGVEASDVDGWMKDGAAPGWVEAKLAALIGADDRKPWPRDEWMLGDARGADGALREYIYHMQKPRFVARVVMVDDDGEAIETPVDELSGVVFTSDGFILCEIDWIDAPRTGEITQLLEAAADAIDRLDESVDPDDVKGVRQ